MPSYHQYKNFNCGDKTISWLSYLQNGISYTDTDIFILNLNPVFWMAVNCLIPTFDCVISWEACLMIGSMRSFSISSSVSLMTRSMIMRMITRWPWWSWKNKTKVAQYFQLILAFILLMLFHFDFKFKYLNCRWKITDEIYMRTCFKNIYGTDNLTFVKLFHFYEAC